MSSTVNAATTYGDYNHIVAGCSGWSKGSNNYVVVAGTGIGFSNCYTG